MTEIPQWVRAWAEYGPWGLALLSVWLLAIRILDAGVKLEIKGLSLEFPKKKE